MAKSSMCHSGSLSSGPRSTCGNSHKSIGRTAAPVLRNGRVGRGQCAATVNAGPSQAVAAPLAKGHGAPQPSTFGHVTEQVMRDHKTLFSSLLHEYAYWVQDAWVTGTIPPELCGTYYRNGPGLQVANPRYQRHTFDGDGMVFSLAFREGKAFFRNRFVRTKGFVDEQAAGKPIYRNAFSRGAADGSLLFNPFDLKFKNVANTGVINWAGQLYALWEAGLPYSLDPATLDTRGETRLGGQLKGPALAAHYRVTTEPDGSQRWVGFVMDSGFTNTTAIFYEFDQQGKMVHETKFPIDAPITLIHDMAVTEHYYVIVMGPVDFNARKFATQYLLSRASIVECLQFDPAKKTQVFLIPRPGRPSGKRLATRTLTAEACFVFHNVNAYEAERPAAGPGSGSGDGSSAEPLVVLDTMRMDEVRFEVNQYNYNTDFYKGGQRTQLYRFVCDPASGTVAEHKLLRRSGEFPANDPRVVARPHAHTWLGVDMVDDNDYWGPLQAVARVSLDPAWGLPHGAVLPGTPAASTATATATPTSSASAASNAALPGPAVPGAVLDLWSPGPRSFVGEPMFIPRPGSSAEGDGWIIAATHNAETQKAELAILDAMRLAEGPLATIHLPHRLPSGLHGSWHGEYVGPDPADGAVPQWQELASIRAL